MTQQVDTRTSKVMIPEPIDDLGTLLRSMSPRLDERRFVFATVGEGATSELFEEAIMLFREREGLTAIVEAEVADRHGLTTVFPCRMITLEVHSALGAVGFLAAILPRLAEAVMAVNPVSAFHHDHLFVPEERAHDAVRVLREIASFSGPDEPGSS